MSRGPHGDDVHGTPPVPVVALVEMVPPVPIAPPAPVIPPAPTLAVTSPDVVVSPEPWVAVVVAPPNPALVVIELSLDAGEPPSPAVENSLPQHARKRDEAIAFNRRREEHPM